MKVFLNPGHSPNGEPDPGAVGANLRECDVAKKVADRVQNYLEMAGVQVVGNLQSNNLNGEDPDQPCVCDRANGSGANIFISIHCNSAENPAAKGTEVWVYGFGGEAEKLAWCIQNQITDSLCMVDRGVKEGPGLIVLHYTAMPAVLVELAFISNVEDEKKLKYCVDDFARAIARGVTDYELME